MVRNRFVAAYAVNRNSDKLTTIWGEEKNFAPDSSHLKLYYEGKDIVFHTSDSTTVLFQGDIIKVLCDIPVSEKASTIDSIIWLYKNQGEGFAKYLDGHFAIIIYDHAIEQLVIIQDKYTFYEKMFWIQKEDIFYLSNNIITLCKYAKIDMAEISKTALQHYLRYTYTSPPHTIYKNVYQMRMGELIEVRGKKLNQSIYDTWSFSEDRVKDRDEAVMKYREVLSKTVQRLYEKNPSTAFLLSGGLDSSLNVALVTKPKNEQIISVGIAAEEKYNSDAPYAWKVSKLYNTDHHEYHFDGHEINDLPQIIYSMGIPYFEPGLMLTHAAFKEASKYAPNIIGGEAADQIFGYCTPAAYRWYSMQEKTKGLFKPFYNLTKHICRSKLLAGSYVSRKIDGQLSKYDFNNWCAAFGFNYSNLKSLFKENFHYKEKFAGISVPDRDLSKLYNISCTELDLDYAFYGVLSVYSHLSELHKVSSHSSYIDRELINLVFSLDHKLRIQIANSKDIVTKVLQRELANDILPPEVLDRPKQGGAINSTIHFNDENFVNNLKCKLLNSEIINQYFHTKKISKLFDLPQKYVARKILLLLAFDLWYYLFVLKPSDEPPTFTLMEYLSDDL